MDNLLKKAGAMLGHLDLFTHMLHLRSLLQLAAHLEERGDRVILVTPQTMTLIGTDLETVEVITNSKGVQIQAGVAYNVLQGLKGHEAPEYAVTREELKALNAEAIRNLEQGDALRAFGETLVRISGPIPARKGRSTGGTAPTPDPT
ncbi:multidrug DMT transporter [Deinococcus hopiensis]|nr:multidrug DMT transporter [Deinococcus hopiensis]